MMRRRVNPSIKYLYIFISLALIILSLVFGSYMNLKFAKAILNTPFVVINGVKNVTINTTKNIGSYFWGIGNLNKKNIELENKNKELTMKNFEMQKIKEENDSLRNMIKIQDRYQHFNLQYANILVRDFNNYTDVIVIDKGSKAGIKEKMTVVAEQGLVGYVLEVNEYTSKISTILDPTISVSVDIPNSDDTAICKGDYSLKDKGQVKLTYIPFESNIVQNDILYTSGLGGIFPKAIPVGNILEVKSNKSDTDRYAIVKPLVDILRIKEVAVILN